MRGQGWSLGNYDTMMKPSRDGMQSVAAGKNRLSHYSCADVPAQSERFAARAQLGRLIRHFILPINRALITYVSPILECSLSKNGIANTAWIFCCHLCS